jgi:hypothetical protein
MKTNLWIVIVVVATFVGFLVGYSASSHGGASPTGHGPAVKADAAAHQATPAPAAAAGYGSSAPAAAPAAAPTPAGYGSPPPASPAPEKKKSPAGY